jgi:hypothetical protein
LKYPNVKNAHVVPATYLKNWAVDGKIAVWLLPGGERLHDQPVENVGTRRRFYERTRPASGDRINDVEWSLGQGEAAATPLLRNFDEQWPLQGDAKSSSRSSLRTSFSVGPGGKPSTKKRLVSLSRSATGVQTLIFRLPSSSSRTPYS